MPPASIAILSSNGCRSMEKNSFPANQWLIWIERTEKEKTRILKSSSTNQTPWVVLLQKTLEKFESKKLARAV